MGERGGVRVDGRGDPGGQRRRGPPGLPGRGEQPGAQGTDLLGRDHVEEHAVGVPGCDGDRAVAEGRHGERAARRSVAAPEGAAGHDGLARRTVEEVPQGRCGRLQRGRRTFPGPAVHALDDPFAGRAQRHADRTPGHRGHRGGAPRDAVRVAHRHGDRPGGERHPSRARPDGRGEHERVPGGSLPQPHLGVSQPVCLLRHAQGLVDGAGVLTCGGHDGDVHVRCPTQRAAADPGAVGWMSRVGPGRVASGAWTAA